MVPWKQMYTDKNGDLQFARNTHIWPAEQLLRNNNIFLWKRSLDIAVVAMVTAEATTKWAYIIGGNENDDVVMDDSYTR